MDLQQFVNRYHLTGKDFRASLVHTLFDTTRICHSRQLTEFLLRILFGRDIGASHAARRVLALTPDSLDFLEPMCSYSAQPIRATAIWAVGQPGTDWLRRVRILTNHVGKSNENWDTRPQRSTRAAAARFLLSFHQDLIDHALRQNFELTDEETQNLETIVGAIEIAMAHEKRVLENHFDKLVHQNSAIREYLNDVSGI